MDERVMQGSDPASADDKRHSVPLPAAEVELHCRHVTVHEELRHGPFDEGLVGGVAGEGPASLLLGAGPGRADGHGEKCRGPQRRRHDSFYV